MTLLFFLLLMYKILCKQLVIMSKKVKQLNSNTICIEYIFE